MTQTAASGDHRIVVGVNGSPDSMRALQWAADYAAMSGVALEIVATWKYTTNYGWSAVPTDFDPVADITENLGPSIELVRAAHPTIAMTLTVIEGEPAQRLVEYSKGADLLVVGTRGHREFTGMLVGSVSQNCLTHAHCPVVVVRATA